MVYDEPNYKYVMLFSNTCDVIRSDVIRSAIMVYDEPIVLLPK